MGNAEATVGSVVLRQVAVYLDGHAFRETDDLDRDVDVVVVFDFDLGDLGARHE